MIESTTEAEIFGKGWAFFVGGGGGTRKGDPLPAYDDPLATIEWMKGFAAALADCDLFGHYPSIEAALVDFGITGELLEELLSACEVIRDGEEWCRWPSVPVRGWGREMG